MRERLLAWTEPAREAIGVRAELPEANGAQRALRALAGGAPIESIYRDALAETRRTYVPQGVPGLGCSDGSWPDTPRRRRAPSGGEPPQSEEELRARLEEEMRRVRVQDLVLQSVASLVNLTAQADREGGRARPRAGADRDRGRSRPRRPARARAPGARSARPSPSSSSSSRRLPARARRRRGGGRPRGRSRAPQRRPRRPSPDSRSRRQQSRLLGSGPRTSATENPPGTH